MSLPFSEHPQLPNNKQQATVLLKHLKLEMEKNPKYKEDYVKCLDSVFEDGDVEEADGPLKDGNTWYISHHAVYHPRRPEKIRVVFDCSARFEGTSLNDHLLTGSDLANALAGVLCRFCEHQITVMCGVEKMFHCFYVSHEDQDLLKFLRWKDWNTDTEPKERSHTSVYFWSSIISRMWNYSMTHLAWEHEKD